MGAFFLVSHVFAADSAGSISFVENLPFDSDFGLLQDSPTGFGEGEFTFEVWILPDNSYPVGPTESGDDQRLNWSDEDLSPYSSWTWWYAGNFLIDGHNNSDFKEGTFSLQFYGGGRVRWLFGDGVLAGPGGHWSVGAYPATETASLLDGLWHQVTLVRRFVGEQESQLELWIDGSLVDTEMSPVRTDMTTYWGSWPGFPAGQQGWFLGAEKQAAIDILAQYEDFKGLVAEMRFWTRAKSYEEIESEWSDPIDGGEHGLVGLFKFAEGEGSVTCDEIDLARCFELINMKPGYWSPESPPIGEIIFVDGFESGLTNAW
jgi:hypothetical protein